MQSPYGAAALTGFAAAKAGADGIDAGIFQGVRRLGVLLADAPERTDVAANGTVVLSQAAEPVPRMFDPIHSSHPVW